MKKKKQNKRFYTSSSYYKAGGEKQNWINTKTAYLIENENYKPDQAYAIANSLYEKEHKYYQVGGQQDGWVQNQFGTVQFQAPKFTTDTWTPYPENQQYAKPRVTSVGQLPAWDTAQTPQPIPNQIGVLPAWNPQGTPTTTADVPTTSTPPTASTELYPAPSFNKFDNTYLPTMEDLGATVQAETPEERIKQGLEITDGTQQMEDFNKTSNALNQNLAMQPFQFFNPYGDVDIATGAQVLGRGIKSGDATDIVSGGLKTGLGVARNVFAGMGQANIQEQAKKKYFDEQRNLITGRNTPQTFQEGGEAMPMEGQMPPQQMEQAQAVPSMEEIAQQAAQAIQQGADPNQVLQQLVQMGIPQDQATQIIEAVMQQMQAAPQQATPMMQMGGEADFSKLKGRQIKDIIYNKDTDSYTVEYE